MKAGPKFTRLHRALHAVMAVAMAVLWTTGFLRMEWMGKRRIIGALQDEAGPAFAAEHGAALAKAIRAPMWEWHVVFAHVMVIAFLARLLYMAARGIRFPDPFRRAAPLKERFQGLTYVLFYAAVAVQAFTGACLHEGFLAGWKEPIEAVHKWGLWWFPVFAALHAAGVLLAEHGPQRGITSRMIGGAPPDAAG